MPATGTGPATVAGAGQQLFHCGVPPCAKARGCSTKPFEEVRGKELLSWLASLIFLSQVVHRPCAPSVFISFTVAQLRPPAVHGLRQPAHVVQVPLPLLRLPALA